MAALTSRGYYLQSASFFGNRGYINIPSVIDISTSGLYGANVLSQQSSPLLWWRQQVTPLGNYSYRGRTNANIAVDQSKISGSDDIPPQPLPTNPWWRQRATPKSNFNVRGITQANIPVDQNNLYGFDPYNHSIINQGSLSISGPRLGYVEHYKNRGWFYWSGVAVTSEHSAENVITLLETPRHIDLSDNFKIIDKTIIEHSLLDTIYVVDKSFDSNVYSSLTIVDSLTRQIDIDQTITLEQNSFASDVRDYLTLTDVANQNSTYNMISVVDYSNYVINVTSVLAIVQTGEYFAPFIDRLILSDSIQRMENADSLTIVDDSYCLHEANNILSIVEGVNTQNENFDSLILSDTVTHTFNGISDLFISNNANKQFSLVDVLVLQDAVKDSNAINTLTFTDQAVVPSKGIDSLTIADNFNLYEYDVNDTLLVLPVGVKIWPASNTLTFSLSVKSYKNEKLFLSQSVSILNKQQNVNELFRVSQTGEKAHTDALDILTVSSTFERVFAHDQIDILLFSINGERVFAHDEANVITLLQETSNLYPTVDANLFISETISQEQGYSVEDILSLSSIPVGLRDIPVYLENGLRFFDQAYYRNRRKYSLANSLMGGGCNEC